MRSVDIAVVGMACHFGGAAGLDEFWHALVNGHDPYAASDAGLPDPIALATETIGQALLDAGLGDEGRLSAGGRATVCVNGEFSSHELAMFVDGCKEKWGLTVAIAAESGPDSAVAGLYAACQSPLSEGVPLIVVGLDSRPDGGAVAVVLKPLEDAALAQDPVYAVIRGCAKGSDAIGHALSAANVAAAEIGLVEYRLHGTSDASRVEQRLAQCFGRAADDAPHALRPLAIRRQSKGHGLAALVQAALSLSNKLMPVGELAMVDEDLTGQLPFFSQRETRPWIQDHRLPLRRLLLCEQTDDGGYALVLEETRAAGEAASIRSRPIKTELDWDSELLVFSGCTSDALAAQLTRLQRYIDATTPAPVLADVAYSLSCAFDPDAPMRLAVVVGDLRQASKLLAVCRQRLSSPTPHFDDLKGSYFSAQAARIGKVACMFPGQGFPGLLGPYVEHIFDLCLRFPEVREAFDKAELRDAHPLDPMPTSQIFFPPRALAEAERKRMRQRLASPRIADAARMHLPAERDLSSFGVSLSNWASWKLLQKFGVPVDMVFGQSHGELSALCAAGALDFDEFIAIHWKASEVDLGTLIASGGGMALASTSAEALAPRQAKYPDVGIAVHISPGFQILGGPVEQLEQFIGELRADGIWTQSLPYPAIHTPRFTAVRPLMEPFLQDLHVSGLAIPAYSAMSCDVYPASPDAIRATVIANLDHPVLLWQTTRRMYQDGARIFIQVGGGATMYAQAKTNIGANDVIGLSIDVDYRSALSQLNHLCGALLIQGVIHDASPLYAHRTLRNLDFDTLPKPDTSETPRMPFVGQATHYVEGKEILLERTLDLNEDLHLAHHLFVNAKGVKPDSECFPVLPMTMGVEWMSEAAACLAPGYGLVGFEEIKATRWIELVESERLPMRAYARMHHHDSELDRLHIATGLYPDAEETPAIQGIAIFGRQYQETLRLPDVVLTDPRPYPWPDKAVYREHRLFHGPLFQCVAGETLLSDHAATGFLEVMPGAGLFRSTSQPQLLADPVLLDGVGQLIGLWAMEQGVYVFPIAIRKLEIYRPTPAPGTRVPVTLSISQFNHRFLSADIELQDGEGGVWMRIQGWQDWVFHWSRNLFDFRRDPLRYCLSDPLQLPPTAAKAAAAHADSGMLRDMAIKVLARFYLHADELRQFDDLAGVPIRQTQWFLGRIAAKDAVRLWLRGGGDGPMLHPAAFVIAQDERRRPFVRGLSTPAPKISIAHSGERAVAIACGNDVGIDLERIETRSRSVLDNILTGVEAGMLDAMPDDEGAEMATCIWCVKEAASKAWGTGIEGSPKHYETTLLQSGGREWRVHHRGSGRNSMVATYKDNGYIIAYAFAEPKADASPGGAAQEEEASCGIG